MRLPSSLVLPLLALGAIPAAHAQAAIHRCVDPAGHPVFTDRRCSTLDATPVLPPAATVAGPAQPPTPDQAEQLCAADPATLRRQVLEAFARHQPNRLAGMMLWDDYGERGAVDQIQALGALVARPLLDLHDDTDGSRTASTGPAPSIYDPTRPLREQLDTPAANAPPAAVAPDPQALIAVTVGADGGPQSTRFAIERRAGCVWLLPPAG